ncbi:MAG: transcription antitermination factor NusB [bacterium]|jgi:N utilization substance protein B
MPSRHRSRQRALQLLFQMDLTGQPAETALASYSEELYSEEGAGDGEPDAFTAQLVRGTAAQRTAIDERIARHSENWKIERMPAVDRNILRMAVYEMGTGTPAAVVINEALELARRFSGEESIPFINGVLDAIRREDERR